MDREEFDRIVAEAVAQLPRVFRERLSNVAIVVEDRPRGEEGRDRSLMGLFHGVPLTEKSTFQSSGPDRVEIYQKNIEAVCRTKREIRSEIRATLLHELGHYFGLSEEELSDI
ncbi:MAG: metallopeptidase family protein [Terriglobia bacterium]|jgi:predicted Zn-dependent protease with MMP-like domain